MDKAGLEGVASPQPTTRTAYIRTTGMTLAKFLEEDMSSNTGTFVDFLARHVYQLPAPAPQHTYIISVQTPTDEKLLEWIINESRPLSPSELEQWKLRNRPRGIVRLRRSDFQVYLTRGQAKSNKGQALLKRLAAEGITCHVMSPADLKPQLDAVFINTDMPSPKSGTSSELESELKALDDYLMLVQSDYLLDRHNVIYSRNWYLSPDQRNWMKSVRDGIPERSADRDEKFDYSTERLARRWAGRIKQRCDCSGQHHRCPRDTESGPQWRCVCKGSCKRNAPCKEGKDRTGHVGYANGRRTCCGNWLTEVGDLFAKKGVSPWSHLTVEDLCAARALGDAYGMGRQGAEWAEDVGNVEAWKNMWMSVSFSGDWTKE